MPMRRPLLRTPSSAYRGTCAIGIITNERYKATTIPSPIDSHFIVSFLNVPMCFASRPKADISNILFDYFVGTGDQAWWHCDSQRLGGLHIDRHLEFGWRLYR